MKDREGTDRRVVLTGGPCGGKTTCLSHLSDHLSRLGLRTYSVPEAATLLFTSTLMCEAARVRPPLCSIASSPSIHRYRVVVPSAHRW